MTNNSKSSNLCKDLPIYLSMKGGLYDEKISDCCSVSSSRYEICAVLPFKYDLTRFKRKDCTLPWVLLSNSNVKIGRFTFESSFDWRKYQHVIDAVFFLLVILSCIQKRRKKNGIKCGQCKNFKGYTGKQYVAVKNVFG